MLSILFQVLYLLLYFFLITLLARFVLSAVLQYGRRWQPGVVRRPDSKWCGASPIRPSRR